MNHAPPVPVLLAAFNGKLFGVDPQTGAVRWEQEDVGGPSTRLHVTPAYALALGGGTLLCCDTMSGSVHWRAETWGDTLLYPGGEQVFVAVAGEVECFAIRTGQRLWKQAFKGKGIGGVSLGVPGHVAQVDMQR